MKRWISGFAIGLASLLFTIQIGADNGGSIEGTWITHVVSAVAGIPPYDVLASFAAGGVLTVSPDASFIPFGFQASPGQGTWQKAGNASSFHGTVAGFFYAVGGNGTPTATFKTNSSVVVNGNTFQGQSQYFLCDLSFNNCSVLGPPGTITGQLLSAAP